MGYIDPSAKLTDCEIAESASVYKNVILRRCRLSEKCIIGDNGRVEDTVMGIYSQIYPNGTVYCTKIGDYSYIQKNCSVWHCEIGKFCSVSWNVSIGGGEHDFKRVTAHSILYAPSYGFVDTAMYNRFEDDLKIGNDVWIAAGAQILRGITVGDGAVIGAGAVVTKDVPPYAIVAGVPAKIIKMRAPDDVIEDMLKIKWWDLPYEALKENTELLGKDLDRDTVKKLFEIKSKIKG